MGIRPTNLQELARKITHSLLRIRHSDLGKKWKMSKTSLTSPAPVNKMGDIRGTYTLGARMLSGAGRLVTFGSFPIRVGYDLPRKSRTTEYGKHQVRVSGRRLNGTSLTIKSRLCQPCNRVPVGLDDASLSGNPCEEIKARAAQDLRASCESYKARRDTEPKFTAKRAVWVLSA